MTTTNRPLSDVDIGPPLATRDTPSLLDQWGAADRALQVLVKFKANIEMEVLRRMDEDGATEVLHPNYTVRLERPAPTYDPDILYGLREFVDEKEFMRGYTPEHQVTAPAAWNMTVVKGWIRYGEAVRTLIDRARGPLLPPRLRIKPKK